MNIHPIVVHFPVALLSLYSIMEVLQFSRLHRSRTWNRIKEVFLILGTLASLVAFQTGEIAEEILGRSELTQIHDNFATRTVWFFAVLSVLYVVRLISNEAPLQRIRNWMWKTPVVRVVWQVLVKISHVILDQKYLLIIIGIIGMGLISVTGALGGAIVYGPDVDPVVSYIYHLFF